MSDPTNPFQDRSEVMRDVSPIQPLVPVGSYYARGNELRDVDDRLVGWISVGCALYLMRAVHIEDLMAITEWMEGYTP